MQFGFFEENVKSLDEIDYQIGKLAPNLKLKKC